MNLSTDSLDFFCDCDCGEENEDTTSIQNSLNNVHMDEYQSSDSLDFFCDCGEENEDTTSIQNSLNNVHMDEYQSSEDEINLMKKYAPGGAEYLKILKEFEKKLDKY